MECGLALDPNVVRAAIEACVAIMQRPDSPANFARGVLAFAVFLLACLGIFAAIKSHLSTN